MATGILEASINALANRLRAKPPADEVIKKIADFYITPDYFYEYRLKKLLEFIDGNREFLDDCLRQSKKYKK